MSVHPGSSLPARRREVLPDLGDVADQLMAQARSQGGESGQILDRTLDDPNLIEVLQTVF